MKNFIPIAFYRHVESVMMNGFIHKSSYNHNYFMGFDNPNDVIVEICDDDNFFEYYRLHGFELDETGKKVLENREYIGAHEYESAFNSDPDDLGFVEIDTDLC